VTGSITLKMGFRFSTDDDPRSEAEVFVRETGFGAAPARSVAWRFVQVAHQAIDPMARAGSHTQLYCFGFAGCLTTSCFQYFDL